MEKKRRFYQSHKEPYVWDPKKNKLLASFVDGQFITQDADVAKTLLGLGYKEVGLRDESPPLMPPPPIQFGDSPDVGVMDDGDSTPPEATEKVTKPKTKPKAGKGKGKGTSKAISRRR